MAPPKLDGHRQDAIVGAVCKGEPRKLSLTGLLKRCYGATDIVDIGSCHKLSTLTAEGVLMKKLLIVLVCLNAFLLADRVWQPAAAGPTPAGNGDVNGDASFNIADPVYLLNWLFANDLSAACIHHC